MASPEALALVITYCHWLGPGAHLRALPLKPQPQVKGKQLMRGARPFNVRPFNLLPNARL
jgi:hypothetical protein